MKRLIPNILPHRVARRQTSVSSYLITIDMHLFNLIRSTPEIATPGIANSPIGPTARGKHDLMAICLFERVFAKSTLSPLRKEIVDVQQQAA